MSAVTEDRLRARLELRRSSAASKHRNRARDMKKGIHKGGRSSSKKQAVRFDGMR